jgi:hypothetical protein
MSFSRPSLHTLCHSIVGAARCQRQGRRSKMRSRPTWHIATLGQESMLGRESLLAPASAGIRSRESFSHRPVLHEGTGIELESRRQLLDLRLGQSAGALQEHRHGRFAANDPARTFVLVIVLDRFERKAPHPRHVSVALPLFLLENRPGHLNFTCQKPQNSSRQTLHPHPNPKGWPIAPDVAWPPQRTPPDPADSRELKIRMPRRLRQH